MDQIHVSNEIADSAIGWFVRLRAPSVTEGERRNFSIWLGEERVHQQAFIEVINFWEDLAMIKQMDFDELKPLSLLWELKQELKQELEQKVGAAG